MRIQHTICAVAVGGLLALAPVAAPAQLWLGVGDVGVGIGASPYSYPAYGYYSYPAYYGYSYPAYPVYNGPYVAPTYAYPYPAYNYVYYY